ncbi:hypothetical protein IT575_05875 [bacterium]|nr:hypothetical protein [bacterium]
MSTELRVLKAGSAISFPAGSSDLNCERFRVMSGGSDRLVQALSVFPQLRRLMTASPPLILGCYPAPLGSFPSAVVVDTCLRPANFVRGLALAASRSMTAIVISQPLILADMLVQAALAGQVFPQRMLLASGGYPMPASLERFIHGLLRQQGCSEAEILHAYGVAEVDFGILGALRRADGGLPYQLLAPEIELRLASGRIELRQVGDAAWTVTQDRGTYCPDGLHIDCDPARVHPVVLAELETWGSRRWWRCTGRIRQLQGQVFKQLRKGLQPAASTELGYHAFFERFGGCFLDKPDWTTHDQEQAA